MFREEGANRVCTNTKSGRHAFQTAEKRVSPRSSRNAGFTLLELTVSVVLLTVIGLLGYIASSGSLKAVDLNEKMTTLQEELRSTMRALSDEVQPAVKKARDGFELPTGAQELKVGSTANATSITFTVPTDMTGTHFSGVMTIRHESEDVTDASLGPGYYGNAALDPGEDTNGDGVLNRRLVLIRPDGSRQALGGGNHLARVVFNLSADGSMLNVIMCATMQVETGRSQTRILRHWLTSNIYLMN